uniref:Uncharacterized protein n=1 Tax=viral metagenome TaxID=1070528 RepID=A0A6C0JT92_9ZZZZ
MEALGATTAVTVTITVIAVTTVATTGIAVAVLVGANSLYSLLAKLSLTTIYL